MASGVPGPGTRCFPAARNEALIAYCHSFPWNDLAVGECRVHYWRDCIRGAAANADWTTATSIDFINVFVAAGTGDFSTTAGASVTIQSPFVFDPADSGTIDPFWTFTSGGLVYSFALETWTINQRESDFLDLSGHGTVTITGFTPTPFAWSLSLDESEISVELAAVSMTNAPKPVPEPGTLALLGLGLAGMGFASRRRKLQA